MLTKAFNIFLKVVCEKYRLHVLFLCQFNYAMKKLIGIFLLGLMMIQLLPIKEVGKLLFNNQIVEEHPGDAGDFSKSVKELKFCKQMNDALKFDPQLFLSILQYNLFAEIPSSPAVEIHTPPPNPCEG